MTANAPGRFHDELIDGNRLFLESDACAEFDCSNGMNSVVAVSLYRIMPPGTCLPGGKKSNTSGKAGGLKMRTAQSGCKPLAT